MKTRSCGVCQISSVEEWTGPFKTATDMFPAATDELVARHLSWMAPDYMDGATLEMLFSFKSFLIRTERLTILVDACVGNDKDRPGRPHWHHQNWPYLANLAVAGVRPEEIDIVMCTHLHTDHVGWNTQLKDGRWVPTFPNARYVFSEKEYRHWENRLGASEIGDIVFNDSVLPVMEAGQADLVKDDYEIDHGIVLEPTPGHTPGHVALHLSSGGDTALFTGDLYHHPLQIFEPELSSTACVDPVLSRQSRYDFLNEYADSGSVLYPAHFTGREVGEIKSDGDGWRFEFASD